MNTRPLFIRTQYGDDSLALVQWAFEAGLSATVVYVDTGFAAESWQTRIEQGEQHAKTCGFKTVRIVSQITFADAVMGRGEFPSSKFQWCSALLKGLPFVDWLESIDPGGHGVILIAKRAVAANAHTDLPEWIEPCQFHGDRTVWHPILSLSNVDRDALLERAGFKPLGHRSLECEPCVNSTDSDLARFNQNNNDSDKQRLVKLEQDLGSVWEWKPTLPMPEKHLDLFYRGCGNHFGCGL